MKIPNTAMGIVLASVVIATAAEAQYTRPTSDNPTPPQEQERPAKPRGATVTLADGRKIQISAEFTEAYQELKAAVDANDAANFPAKLAAANAAAKNADERFLVAQLQLRQATKTNGDAEVAAAIDAMLATGAVAPAQQTSAYLGLGKARYNLKQYDQAVAAFQKVLAADPNNTEAFSLLAQTYSLQGKKSEALAMLRKAIADRSAAGAKAPEELYKRAVATAYETKAPSAVELARDWVRLYPSPTNWSDALRIYRNLTKPDGAMLLDTLRLARAAGGMKGDGDYHSYAFEAVTRGFPGEAKAMLEEGFAANAIDRNKALFKTAITEATGKSAGEQARLADLAKMALAAPTAKQALSTGDALYGYGQYAKAAELYRAALGKSGADASLINLHLGMALARAGDKAGATAALNAVTGTRAELAKFWLAWLASRP